MYSMLSQRGNKLLVYKDFKFSKCILTESGQRWRCSKKTCKAVLYTDNAGDVLFKETGDHNHEPCPTLHRQFLSNSVKRKTSGVLIEPPAKVIRREIAAAPEALVNMMERADVDRVRRNLSHAKRSLLPPLPKNIDDVHEALDSIEIKNIQGENLLLINSRSENIIAFAPKSNLEYLKTIDHIFMDGSFSYAPKHFYQLFTIHSVENGNYVPLIFCLLPNKKELTYKKSSNCCVTNVMNWAFCLILSKLP